MKPLLSLLPLGLASILASAPASAATVYATVVGVEPIYASGSVREVCVPYRAAPPVHYTTSPDHYRLYYPDPQPAWPHSYHADPAASTGRGQYCHTEYSPTVQVLGYDVTYLHDGLYFLSRLSHAPALGTRMEISVPGW